MGNSPAAQRVLAQQRSMQGQSQVCPRCKSVHMFEVQVSQYRAGGYGTVEIQQESDAQTFPLLLCAGCNFPILPKPPVGHKAGGIYETARKEFRESIEKGQKFLLSQDAEATKTAVLETAAGKGVEGDVKALRDRLAELEKQLGIKTNA